MTRAMLTGIVIACAATAFAAQTPSKPSSSIPQPTSANPATAQTVIASGCVTRGTSPAEPFTLSSPTGSPTTGTPPTAGDAASALVNAARGYRLSGSDVKRYVGRRVQIVGGLIPSPNASATMGASSSSSGVAPQTGVSGAINSMPGTPATTPMMTLPEFRVVSVKPLGGPCPR